MSASVGIFNIDEFIYLMSVDAMKSHGSLGVENGTPPFDADSLRMWFLVKGPEGLTPQYPIGVPVAGAIFCALWGTKGAMFTNVIASFFVFVLIWRWAFELTNSERRAWLAVSLLAVGTFWLEYTYGYWPHTASTFFTTYALKKCFDATTIESGAPESSFGLAGLSVGVGIFFRTDVVMVMPIAAAVAVTVGTRPLSSMLWLGAGFLPGGVATAVANHFKFGSYNPISYGNHAGGGIDIASYFLLAVVLLVAVVSVMAFSSIRGTRWMGGGKKKKLAMTAFLLLLGSVIALFHTTLSGFFALWIDVRSVQEWGLGASRDAWGIVSFFGLPKEALAQSLPWLGLLGGALMRKESNAGASFVHLVVLMSIIWTLPFAARFWHGGLGNNMRYLLPLLPPLCIYAVWTWARLIEGLQRPWVLGLAGLASGVASGFLWTLLSPSHEGGAQQVLSSWVFWLLLGHSALAALRQDLRITLRTWVHWLASFSVGLSSLFGWQDLNASQARRDALLAMSTSAPDLPVGSLLVAHPDGFQRYIGREGLFISVPDRLTGIPDIALIEEALKSGYRVYVAHYLAVSVQEHLPAYRYVRLYPMQEGALVELAPPFAHSPQ